MASVSRAAGARIGLSAVGRGAQRLGAFDLADDGAALFHHLQDPGWPERLARRDVGGFGRAISRLNPICVRHCSASAAQGLFNPPSLRRGRRSLLTAAMGTVFVNKTRDLREAEHTIAPDHWRYGAAKGSVPSADGWASQSKGRDVRHSRWIIPPLPARRHAPIPDAGLCRALDTGEMAAETRD